MTLFTLFFCALISLVASQCAYSDRVSSGMGGMGESSGSGYMGSGSYGGPIVTSTTVTTITDLNTGMTRAFRSNVPTGNERTFGTGGDKTFLEGIGLHNILNESDISLIKTSWNTLKRRGDFAPKVFIRYFKAKPESQKLFPAFANVAVNDLPNNHDFLVAAYNCVNSLNYILPHLKYPHPENCPAFTNLKSKYNEVDIKRFGSIWMTAMQEELGNNFTPEVRDVWKKAVMALSNFASQ